MTRPSVLVGIMGPYPMLCGEGGNTFDNTVEVLASIEERVDSEIYVIPEEGGGRRDYTIGSGQADKINAMRNHGVQVAMEGGYDYLLLLENDVILQPDTIPVLIETGVGIISPRLRFGNRLVDDLVIRPQPPEEGSEPWEMRWSAMSALLFSQKALKAATFFGWKEADCFDYWNAMGNKAYTHLGVEVEVVEIPHGYMAMMDRVAKIEGDEKFHWDLDCDGVTFEISGMVPRCVKCGLESLMIQPIIFVGPTMEDIPVT